MQHVTMAAIPENFLPAWLHHPQRALQRVRSDQRRAGPADSRVAHTNTQGRQLAGRTFPYYDLGRLGRDSFR